MRADLSLLHFCLLLPVVRGTLSKTDAKKANKIQEVEVRQSCLQMIQLLHNFINKSDLCKCFLWDAQIKIC